MTVVDDAVATLLVGRGGVFTQPHVPAVADGVASLLTSTDRIGIVVLDGTFDSAGTMAMLDEGTGHELILILITGDHVTVSATRFPTGLAVEFWYKADGLSPAMSGKLGAFINRVHQYQATDAGQESMESVPAVADPPPPVEPGVSGWAASGGILAAVLVIVACITVVWHITHPVDRRRDRTVTDVQSVVSGRVTSMSELGAGIITILTGCDGLGWHARTDSPVVRVADSVRAHLVAIEQDWAVVEPNTLLVSELEDITRKHLPALVGAFTGLPERIRQSDTGRGLEARQWLTKGLGGVDRRLREVVDAIDDHNLDRLELEGRFLAGSYGADNPLSINRE